MPRRGSDQRRTVIAVVAAVLALLAVVTVAAEDLPLRAPAGQDRDPIDLPALPSEVWFSLFTLLMVAGLVLFVMSMAAGPSRRVDTPRRSPLRQLIGFLVTLLIIVTMLMLADRPEPEERLVAPVPQTQPRPPAAEPDRPTRPFSVALWGLLVVAQVAVVAAVLYARRGPRDRVAYVPALTGEHEAVREALESSEEELLREPDPRRAIVAAYHVLLHRLAAAGIARRPAETPDELVVRVFASLPVDQAPLARVTALFSEARFSEHAITERHKADALAALREIIAALGARAPSAVGAAP